MQDVFFHSATLTPPTPLLERPSFDPPDLDFDHGSMFDVSTPPYAREHPRPRFEADAVTKSLSSLFDSPTPPDASRASLSGQSPSLMDLRLPGPELKARLGTVTTPPVTRTDITPVRGGSPSVDHDVSTMDSLGDDVEEEVVREPQLSDVDLWTPRPPAHSRSFPPSSAKTRDDSVVRVYRQPEAKAGSPEMLMLRFDKQTCGILSVKDGPTENPWRTLIWPLARDEPALYHAIASLTAFHTSRERPELRVDGMEHMRSSIRHLALRLETMSIDAALATTLVLAFSESWDQHISTGIEHLRGARILVHQALVSHRKRNVSGDDFARLRFLCNTWVYMDVIARLTSVDEEDSSDFAHLLAPLNDPFSRSEIDPLMGCASSLFPLIGRVANLCRKVRNVTTNSIAIISQAMELKEAIVQWSPPPLAAIERPEDPTSEIQHALQTAEAYRYSTLLCLHQAVPEIPSWTSAQLAKKVLVYLATVPLSSRLVIVQIYPLLAAGCEAYELEDRQWVQERWQSMAARMWIGNIDRCWEVMQEVWCRRDGAEAARNAAQEGKRRSTTSRIMHSESSKRKFEEELARDDVFSFSGLPRGTTTTARAKRQRGAKLRGSYSPDPPVAKRRIHEPLDEEMDVDVTVRGRMHWVGVMKDWRWESKCPRSFHESASLIPASSPSRMTVLFSSTLCAPTSLQPPPLSLSTSRYAPIPAGDRCSTPSSPRIGRAPTSPRPRDPGIVERPRPMLMSLVRWSEPCWDLY